MSLRLCTAAAAAIALALACQPQQQAPVEAAPADTSEVAARIDGEPITVAELDEWVKEDLFRDNTDDGNQVKLYEVRRAALAALITERTIEAAAVRRDLTPEQLIEQEVAALGPVADEEIASFYDQNRERVGERTLEELTEPIRNFLESQRRQQAIEAIEERAEVTVALAPPRFEIRASGPALGPDEARVTIVEFSDFQCPFCKRAAEVVKAVRERYPEDVRVVYKQFPLENIHPEARAAAEASLCAADQERFWEYHDLLFQNTKQLSQEDLVRYAGELELDVARFEQCLAERTHEARVDEDLMLGEKLGVTGTPAFFVNGIMITGARPVENFAEVIDAELARIEAAESS